MRIIFNSKHNSHIDLRTGIICSFFLIEGVRPVSPHNDAAFLRMFIFIIGALVAFSVIIAFIANSVSSDLYVHYEQVKEAREQEQIDKRIAPIGEVKIAGQELDTTSSETAVVDKSAEISVAADHEVKMLNGGPDGAMVFSPAVLNVSVGQTVKFIPTNPGHNSASIKGLIPEGSTSWSGDLNKEIIVTIDKEGVYVYQCSPHVSMAMVGVIVAGSPTNLESIKKESDKMQFVMNKERLSKYLNSIK